MINISPDPNKRFKAKPAKDTLTTAFEARFRGLFLHWILHTATYLPVTFSNDFFVHYTTFSTRSEKCQFIAKNGELQDGEVTTLYNVTEENLRKEERAKLIAAPRYADVSER